MAPQRSLPNRLEDSHLELEPVDRILSFHLIPRVLGTVPRVIDDASAFPGRRSTCGRRQFFEESLEEMACGLALLRRLRGLHGDFPGETDEVAAPGANRNRTEPLSNP